jgi:hypothetical protein
MRQYISMLQHPQGADPRKGRAERHNQETWNTAIERNAAKPKDFNRKAPRPVVIDVQINGNTAKALIDSGSKADFISTRLVDQLCLKKEILAKPMGLQLAITGSRSKVNCEVVTNFQYQEINTQKRFDVANLDTYD